MDRGVWRASVHGHPKIVIWPVVTSRERNQLRFVFFFKEFYLFLFMAARSLHCCARAFSACGKWGLLFVAVHWHLIAVTFLGAEHRL